MKSMFAIENMRRVLRVTEVVVCAGLSVPVLLAAQSPQAASQPAKTQAAAPVAGSPAKTFATPQDAANALIDAADKDDETALGQIFGSSGKSIIASGEPARDKQRITDFAAKAHEKMSVATDPKNPNHATLIIGSEDWPFPVPIVKQGAKWAFDSKAGRREILYRRIGSNELDAIQICHGYVDAQQDYATKPREGYNVAQYAQRIISSPGKQDGLAWQNADGTWGGPVGENIAKVISQGYTSKQEPYHGYFFKVLKGQGPAAPLGKMDYVISGVMIGGFALVAAPAEYRVTGVKTFIVSNDGVVYQKDLGPTSLDQFKAMELFNPDASWTPVGDDSN